MELRKITFSKSAIHSLASTEHFRTQKSIFDGYFLDLCRPTFNRIHSSKSDILKSNIICLVVVGFHDP